MLTILSRNDRGIRKSLSSYNLRRLGIDMVLKDCEQCGEIMKARQADINRGWGRFCSKSCKAKKQTKREFYKPRDMWYYDYLEDVGHPLASGFFGHGQDT